MAESLAVCKCPGYSNPSAAYEEEACAMQLQVMMMEFRFNNVTRFFSPFRYTNLKTGNERKIDSFRADAIHDHWNKKFSAFAIVCPLTADIRARIVKLPETVGITISNRKSMRKKTSFVRIKYPQNVLLGEAEKKIDR